MYPGRKDSRGEGLSSPDFSASQILFFLRASSSNIKAIYGIWLKPSLCALQTLSFKEGCKRYRTDPVCVVKERYWRSRSSGMAEILFRSEFFTSFAKRWGLKVLVSEFRQNCQLTSEASAVGSRIMKLKPN